MRVPKVDDTAYEAGIVDQQEGTQADARDDGSSRNPNKGNKGSDAGHSRLRVSIGELTGFTSFKRASIG